MAYNLIHQNNYANCTSFTSDNTTNIHAECHTISEGQLQFDELVIHLTKYKAPFVIAISEDATHIITRVESQKLIEWLDLFCHVMIQDCL